MAVGRSRKMAGLAHEVERIGPTDGTVLLLGNPGAGKELVANALHRCSPRHAAGDEKREHPLAVNMVALERNLVLDELFGHERGAFTGASLERAGIFETARGGTVLLDEIGEIDAELQQKLLRVIESRCVRRLGSSIEAPVDVRIVCATNRPIDVLQTRFRWDFYTRVVQQTIAVPSLRERWAEESPHVLEEDIAELFEFVVDEMNRNPRHRRQIRPAATAIRFMTGLVAQYLDGTNSIFAGEMRALRNVIERAYERAQYDGAEAISMGQVAFTLTRFQPLGPQTKPKPAGWSLENTFGSLRLAVVERVVIAEALARARSNQKKAAELLGIHRDTLRNKMREYGLSQ
jgi:transcriptional regulator with PAS, ATPase and Fis domain